RHGLGFARNFHELPLPELFQKLTAPSSERYFLLYEALRKGADIETLYRMTYIKPWFLEQMQELVKLEERILDYRGKEIPENILRQAKQDGFSDRYLAKLLNVSESDIRDRRKQLGIVQGWHILPVSGVENAVYYYSTFNGTDQVTTSDRPKIMVLGGGPNRIGQGIEFDYCCVHAAFCIRDMGYESIMVNCNPETVSTDYDTSNKLYFEPVTVEDVLAIYEKEHPIGVIVQFGGQTPLNIARELANAGVKILGTSPEAIDLAEDRDRFRKRMDAIGIPMPESGIAATLEEAVAIAQRIGYPLMVRPSYVLGGRGMEVVHDETMLREYVTAAAGVTPDRPILIDRFLVDAIEAEADAISDGRDAFVPAVMEHIERAGIHSGDSACVIPPISIPPRHLETIREYTRRIAVELHVVGLMNIQYAIAKDTVYVLEANPRASRTVPIVSKVCNIPMARLATQLMLGKTLKELGLTPIRHLGHYGVKEAVFPFNMFPEVDPVLGPEMRSTGEVLGLAESFGLAFYKAEEAAMQRLPLEGSILFTVTDSDKPAALGVAKRFVQMGFTIRATRGTHRFFTDNGVLADRIGKMHEGRPNIVDAIKNGEIQLVINTPSDRRSEHDDSYIRKAAVKFKIPYITTIAAAEAAARGIDAWRRGHDGVKSLQEYHAEIQ
ncbi:MAG: carbamoyl-phosphate synthase large subunit, partial [Thermodesulfobacteriota bacterium]